MKHAYCIMAHGNWTTLQKLVDCLDDERNDVYIHVDKKSYDDYSIKVNLTGGVKCKHSSLKVFSLLDVRWSDVSQVEAELSLYRAVLESHVAYSRIHLISGQDLPIKPINEIIEFFEQNRNVEFIASRYAQKYYHFFVRIRRKNKIFEISRKILVAIQMAIGVDRLKNCDLHFHYGSNWCSLTQEAVSYIVEMYPHYKDVFRRTTSSDELYKQMLLDKAGSKFKISPQGDLRYVHFPKGKPSPYTLTIQDYEQITTTECLFARKFDYDKQPEIVSKIVERVMSKKY